MKQPEIIVLHETVMQSFVKDAITFAMVFSLVGVGVLLDSVAMQWIGGIMAMIGILSSMARMKKEITTPQKAADYLYKNFGAIAHDDSAKAMKDAD